MTNKKKRILRDRLERILYSKAHAKGCRNVYRCPQVCDCRHRKAPGTELDLHTAIIWQAAEVVSVNSHPNQLRRLWSVADMHKRKYPVTVEILLYALEIYRAIDLYNSETPAGVWRRLERIPRGQL